MLTQITDAFAICINGPREGECFEVPLQTVQLSFHGHHYRFVGYSNGVALYEHVTHR